MKKMSLIQRFSLLSLLVMTVVAFAFGCVINRTLEKEMLHFIINSISSMVNEHVVTHFSVDELTAPISGAEYDSFSRKIKHLSVGIDNNAVTIWNKDMRVVWSRDKKLTGKHFPDNNTLRKTLQGESIIHTFKPDEITQKYNSGSSSKNFVELYIPIKFNAQEEVDVVFELYKDFNPFFLAVARHRQAVWFWTFMGSAFIYLILFCIVRKASARIDKQTHEMSASVSMLEKENTDGKRLERQLKKASKQWRATFDSTKDIIIMLDKELTILRTNKAATIFFNKSYLELIGKEIDQVLRDVKLHIYTTPFLRMKRTGQRVETEVYSMENHSWTAMSIDPVLNENDVTGAVLIMRDITEIKRMQDSIVTAKNDWEDTFDIITDIITIHDKNHNIIRANKAAERILKLPDPENHKVIKCFRYYHGTDMPPARCYCCDSLYTGKAASFERYEPHLDLFIEVRAIPRFNSSNELVGLIHIIRDITKIKTSETEKVNLQNELLQTQKMKSIGRLAGGVAHDFNNIVSVINGFSELALKELPEESPIKTNITAILDAGKKAAALTNKLLAFSRKQVLAMKAVNINTIIEGMSRILGRLIGEDVILKINTEMSSRNVMADQVQIEQILLNLAVNARDAMPDGGDLIIKTMDVELEKGEQIMDREHIEPGPYVMLSVKDTGTGMSKEVREHIFEPFYTTKDIGKGTGMGMATVYGIVKQHQGHIVIDSEIGSGTEFKVYLPAFDGETEDTETSGQDRPAGGNETILYVDDETMLRKLMVNMLGPLGYRVLSASSGEDALQVSAKFKGRIDLLLTDVIMPGMNGRKLADIIKTKRPDTKVVFVSGYSDDAIAHHGVLDEEVFFISKPLTEAAIAGKIREVLDGKNQTAGLQRPAVTGTLSVLLAEDNEDIRMLIQSYLEDYECRLDIAENGEIALNKFKSGKYDLVLMDIQMPKMDGCSATREIRKWEAENQTGKTPVIAMTGYSSRKDMDKCLDAGCTSHIAKPLKQEILIKVLFADNMPDKNSACETNEKKDKIKVHVDKELEDIVPVYIEKRHEDIIILKKALETDDYETIRITGHSMKGSGGGYGFDGITDIGSCIEIAAKEKDPEQISESIKNLEDYMLKLKVTFD